MHNKEFRIITFISLFFIGLTAYLLWPLSIPILVKAVILTGMCTMYITYLLTTRYRFQKIKNYTAYLNRVQNGEYSLPIMESEEGELSILQHEMYKVIKRLIEQAELLQQKKEYLADALSNISHQLKTPLTSLLMMADLLNNPNLPEERRIQFTKNMISGLERMEWLIQALLKLSKLDSNTITMKREPVVVKELVHESIRELIVPLEEKGIHITVDGDDDVEFIGDYSWSLEAVSNIIKNCMEHTKTDGEIQIHFEKNRFYTLIKIKDTGEGIPKEDLPHIFERFYKGKNSSKDSVGIGLALAKEIFVRQQGMITVESEEKVGSEFTIKLYS